MAHEASRHQHGASPDSSRIGRLSALFLLYFVQGLPYGFQDKLLPVLLRKGGKTYTQLSLLKLLFLPWLCKPLWAPLVDGYATRRWWILTSMSSMACCCFLSNDGALWSLGVSLLFLNMASATQDIAVDSLSISVLPPSDLGVGSAIQVVAYKAGVFFAGAVLLWIQIWLGWSWMFIAFGTVYLASVICTGRLRIVSKDRRPERSTKAGFLDIYRKVISVPGTSWLVLYLLLYKLGERGSGANFPLFLLDSGASVASLGFWNGIVVQAALIAGSIYGGRCNNLMLYSTWRSVAILIEHVLIFVIGYSGTSLSERPWLLIACFVSHAFLNFLAGVITTATFTMLMAQSQSNAPPDISGTHYATLAALEVAGKLIFVSCLGPLLDRAGFFMSYFLFFTLSVLVLPVLKYQPPLKKQD